MIDFYTNDGEVIISVTGCTVEVLHSKQGSERKYEPKN